MATKRIPYGLLAVFYGEDDYAMAPNLDKPYYVWQYQLNQRETAEIGRNMVDYGYDSWFDLWFDIIERIGSISPRIKWFKTMSDARAHAENILRAA